MTKIDENIQTAQNMLNWIVERCYELEEENKKLKAENEYLHNLLPEADWYIIEKQLEKRLWNDGEEDVVEDWWE